MNKIFIHLSVLSVIVFLHELGHYLGAVSLGIPVEVFSIGFGPRDYSLILGNFVGTEFRLSPIFLGGYVTPVMDDVETWMRVVVLFCGPLVNIILLICSHRWFWPNPRQKGSWLYEFDAWNTGGLIDNFLLPIYPLDGGKLYRILFESLGVPNRLGEAAIAAIFLLIFFGRPYYLQRREKRDSNHRNAKVWH